VSDERVADRVFGRSWCLPNETDGGGKVASNVDVVEIEIVEWAVLAVVPFGGVLLIETEDGGVLTVNVGGGFDGFGGFERHGDQFRV
jgi:hypothetical protein